jgi:flagellar biosynthesis protein FlhB
VTEKRFPPSVSRLLKARRDGKMVKSRVVIVAAGWLGLFLFFLLTRPWVRIGTLIQWFRFKVLSPVLTLKYSALFTAALLLLSIGSVAGASVIASLLQTKGLVTPKQIVPDLTRLQPLGFVSRFREGAIDAAVGFARGVVILALMTPLLGSYLWSALELFRAPGEWIIPGIGGYLLSAVGRGVGALVVLGGCAYCLAWRRFVRQHRMSFEEVKEEFKENEGDPHLRAARRHEHQMMTMAEIEKRVRSSKVLVIRKQPDAAAR